MRAVAVVSVALLSIGAVLGPIVNGLSVESWPPLAAVAFFAGAFGLMVILAAAIFRGAPPDSGSIDDILPGTNVGPGAHPDNGDLGA